MIIITFDDAINDENWDLYQDKLFPTNYKVRFILNYSDFQNMKDKPVQQNL